MVNLAMVPATQSSSGGSTGSVWRWSGLVVMVVGAEADGESSGDAARLSEAAVLGEAQMQQRTKDAHGIVCGTTPTAERAGVSGSLVKTGDVIGGAERSGRKDLNRQLKTPGQRARIDDGSGDGSNGVGISGLGVIWIETGDEQRGLWKSRGLELCRWKLVAAVDW